MQPKVGCERTELSLGGGLYGLRRYFFIEKTSAAPTPWVARDSVPERAHTAGDYKSPRKYNMTKHLAHEMHRRPLFRTHAR